MTRADGSASGHQRRWEPIHHPVTPARDTGPVPEPSTARPQRPLLTVLQGGAAQPAPNVATLGDGGGNGPVPGPALAPGPGTAGPPVRLAPPSGATPIAARLAADVAVLLARHGDRQQGDGSLLLPLALSVGLQRHDATPADLLDGMHLLRRALLQVAHVDGDDAPVPLGAGETVAACLQWGRYLHALLYRAATAAGTAPARLAAATAAHLLDR